MQLRDGMLPSLLLTRRTPISAGDWPTVPMPYCWSIRIFQISLAVSIRSLGLLAGGAAVQLEDLQHVRIVGLRPCAPFEAYHLAYSGPMNASVGSTGMECRGNR